MMLRVLFRGSRRAFLLRPFFFISFPLHFPGNSAVFGLFFEDWEQAWMDGIWIGGVMIFMI